MQPSSDIAVRPRVVLDDPARTGLLALLIGQMLDARIEATGSEALSGLGGVTMLDAGGQRVWIRVDDEVRVGSGDPPSAPRVEVRAALHDCVALATRGGMAGAFLMGRVRVRGSLFGALALARVLRS